MKRRLSIPHRTRSSSLGPASRARHALSSRRMASRELGMSGARRCSPFDRWRAPGAGRMILPMAIIRSLAPALLVALFAAGSPRSVAPTSEAARLPVTLLIRVIDSASRLPLPNAEVSTPSRRRLTDAEGNVRFPWPEGGAISIRVRQLGFRYADRTLRRGTSRTATVDTAVVALAPAAFALPQVVTQAEARCPAVQDSATMAFSRSTMELLRFGAE